MIPAPIAVFPAEGRVPAAQAGAPSGMEAAFGAWLASLVPPEGTGDQARAEVVLPEEAVMAEEGAADIAVIPLVPMDPPPVVAPGAAIVFAPPDEDAGADIGIGDGGMPLAEPVVDAGTALAEPAGIGEAVPFDRARVEVVGQDMAAARPVASPEQNPAMAAAPAAPVQALNGRGEAPALPQAPAPPPVARQVADAILHIQGDSTEIVLTPPELGTVRIVIARDPHGLVVTLAAERPEALDLMRRHADLLRQELSLQGDEAARLDFLASGQGEGGQAGGRSARAGGGFPARRDAGPIQLEPMIRPVAVPGRIDMRI